MASKGKSGQSGLSFPERAVPYSARFMPEARRSRLRGQAVLVLSIAANVFFIGVALSAWLLPGHLGIAIGRPRTMYPQADEIRSALTPDQRVVFAAIEAIHKPRIHAKLDPVFAERLKIASLVRQQPFNKDAVEAEMAPLRSNEAAVSIEVQDMLIDLMDHLDQDGRERLATLFEIRGQPHGGWTPANSNAAAPVSK